MDNADEGSHPGDEREEGFLWRARQGRIPSAVRDAFLEECDDLTAAGKLENLHPGASSREQEERRRGHPDAVLSCTYTARKNSMNIFSFLKEAFIESASEFQLTG